MKPLTIFCVLTLALLLAACGSATTGVPTQPAARREGKTPAQPTTQPAETSPAKPSQPVAQAITQLPEQSDAQGAVEVAVKPLDLGKTSQQLKFEVSLNTHSVDLSMDLAALATMTTDTGLTVQALAWDAPKGGHHASGTLTFPASTADGKVILDGVSKLTLVIKNVDAPERTFTWNLK